MSRTATEVLVIGGGIIGTMVARELTRYKVDVTLVEKEVDFGWGSTKSSATLVCQGGDGLEFRREYHRSKFVWESMSLMEPLCQELDVPFNRIGELWIFRNGEELAKLHKMRDRAEAVGITTHRFLTREELHQLEPNVTTQAMGALYDPTLAVIDPVRLCLSLAANAQRNGADMLLGTRVLDIRRSGGEYEVATSGDTIRCKYIVNAAGVFADKIARMVNADDFVLFPVRAYMAITDKKTGGLISHGVFARPTQPGEMNVVLPSVHGNLFFGIQLQLAPRGDLSTTARMAEAALRNAQGLVPALSDKDIIRSFAGFIMFQNFDTGWHECVLEASQRVPRFINVSIGFPGVSAAPAAGKEVVRILAAEGLRLVEKPDFDAREKAITDFSEISEAEQHALIKQDRRFGHVVCRCETVTEGEVVEAIRRGATTLDGVKFRTRAGMGRCQAGFCSPRVTKILARELGTPQTRVTKRGGDSTHLLYKSKELLRGKAQPWRNK